MEKLFIQNRKNQKLAVTVERPGKPAGLVFIMHGLGGFKEQDHVQTFAEAFRVKGFVVVMFDTANTIGESDGQYEDATITNYYEDLQDVIAWAGRQAWYMEPFWLAGHSLGGICISLFAANNHGKVKAIAPISTVVSGALSLEAHSNEEMEEWERTGWQIRESSSKPGVMKKLKWSHIEDRLKYDLLPLAGKLTMPVLMIVGDKDTSTLPAHQQLLFDKLPGEKEIHTIKGAPHTFREERHLNEIKQIFFNWIDKYNNGK